VGEGLKPAPLIAIEVKSKRFTEFWVSLIELLGEVPIVIARLWDMTDIVALIDAAAPAAKPRAPYKTKGRMAAAQAENSN